jgi:hypothetical protein
MQVQHNKMETLRQTMYWVLMLGSEGVGRAEAYDARVQRLPTMDIVRVGMHAS